MPATWRRLISEVHHTVRSEIREMNTNNVCMSVRQTNFDYAIKSEVHVGFYVTY